MKTHNDNIFQDVKTLRNSVYLNLDATERDNEHVEKWVNHCLMMRLIQALEYIASKGGL